MNWMYYSYTSRWCVYVITMFVCRYLFNDAEVKPFDSAQIPSECFGGEMTVTSLFLVIFFAKIIPCFAWAQLLVMFPVKIVWWHRLHEWFAVWMLWIMDLCSVFTVLSYCQWQILTAFALLLPSPPVGNIWAVMTDWMIAGKIIKTVTIFLFHLCTDRHIRMSYSCRWTEACWLPRLMVMYLSIVFFLNCSRFILGWTSCVICQFVRSAKFIYVGPSYYWDGWPCPGSIPGAGNLFCYETNQPPKAKSAFHPSRVSK